MRPPLWQPSLELTTAEQAVVARIRRAKRFPFVRRVRHELVSDAFQQELAIIYKDSTEGFPPVPPAQLALATILQAYTGVSDDAVIEALLMDRRWQLVRDCLDCATAPFSKATLVRFRRRLMAHELDRRLVERSVELAERDGGFAPRALRVALDSRPWWGAGRVEDTSNLLGHARRCAVGVLARQQGRERAAVAAATGASLVAHTRRTAALDRDWDAPAARTEALAVVLAALDAAAAWVAAHPEQASAAVVDRVLAAAPVRGQDVIVAATDGAGRRQGGAPDRRIAIEDPEMRHGRKSRSQVVDGDKRHVLRDLDSGVIRAAGVTPANVPAAAVTDAIRTDRVAQQVTVGELHSDRAYLSSTLVRERPPEMAVDGKAWPVRSGTASPKTAFDLEWEQGTSRCPNGVVASFTPGGVVPLPAETCAGCPRRAQCTQSVSGRTVTLHPDERLLEELRTRHQTAAGRAQLRERVAVEHSLAHVGYWQGGRARYRGTGTNRLDLRRVVVVHTLHGWARLADRADRDAA